MPAVPCFIRGTFEAMPRERRWPRPHQVRIVFGAPVEPGALSVASAEEAAETRIAEGLRAAVVKLAEQSRDPRS